MILRGYDGLRISRKRCDFYLDAVLRGHMVRVLSSTTRSRRRAVDAPVSICDKLYISPGGAGCGPASKIIVCAGTRTIGPARRPVRSHFSPAGHAAGRRRTRQHLKTAATSLAL